MGEQVTVDRKVFLSKIGTFFIVISLFSIIIFIASDVSRNDPGHHAGNTQTYIVAAVQAIQTRDIGSTQAAVDRVATPTLVPVQNLEGANEILPYFPAFCLGSVGLVIGWVFRRMGAPPAKPGTRFEGIRKMQQKQREAKAKKEAEKKEKEAKKKSGGK